MRTIFLAGGFVGFAVVSISGFLSDRSFDHVIRDAAIGCLVGAFMFRWLWGVYIKVLDHAIKTKRAARQAAEEAEAAMKATPVVPLGAKVK